MDEEQEKVQHSIADTPPGYKSWLRGEVAALLPVSETSAHNLAEDPGDGSVARCVCGWVPAFRAGIDEWGYLQGVNAHIAHARALEHAQRNIEARHKVEVREAYASAAPLTRLAIQLGNPWLLEEIRERGWTTVAPIVPLEHQPRRGDAIDAWLQQCASVHTETKYKEIVLGLVEHYQQLADEGTPMRAVVQEN